MQLKSTVLSTAVKSALVAAGLAAGVASAMTPGACKQLSTKVESFIVTC